MQYCSRQHVELVPEKTKLLAWCPSGQQQQLNLEMLKLSCPININSMKFGFSTTADHVGVLRSVRGGHILDRLTAHRGALASICPCGAARHHQANPAAAIQLNKLYGCPVFLSGLPTLVLASPGDNVQAPKATPDYS